MRMEMVRIRGRREGAAVVLARRDIAASLVEDGYAEYVDGPPKDEVTPARRAQRVRVKGK